MDKKKVIIIGAGPAGVTAGYELSLNEGYDVTIFDENDIVGGISRTVQHNGYKIDLGPHRFFSKVDRVNELWQKALPLQGKKAKDDLILERDIPLSTKENAPDPEKEDKVLLYKNRLTRIFYLRKFFNYPITLSPETLKNLGFIRLIKIGFSYLKIRLFPVKKEKSLEDFFINRFGKELYLTFFKDYTEKVWGVKCCDIPPEWGSQRVKGVSITKVLKEALKKVFKKRDTNHKKVETSLIEGFVYPKYGAGQMYTEIANLAVEKGVKLNLNHKVINILFKNGVISGVRVKNLKTNKISEVYGDIVISCMAIKELMDIMEIQHPKEIKEISDGLVYRDYLTVGLLLDEMKLKNKTQFKSINNIIPDNWIYIQERDVKIGRLDIFNNFSVYMLNDINKIWLGAEYFCTVGDEIWSKNDKEIADFAISELEKIDLIRSTDVIDKVVFRVEKAYPAYFGTYNKFDRLIDYINKFENLFLIGRNGMHKYNNMDHSMLSAMTAVDNIVNNIKTKENIWAVNTEEEYHEEKK